MEEVRGSPAPVPPLINAAAADIRQLFGLLPSQSLLGLAENVAEERSIALRRAAGSTGAKQPPGCCSCSDAVEPAAAAAAAAAVPDSTLLPFPSIPCTLSAFMMFKDVINLFI